VLVDIADSVLDLIGDTPLVRRSRVGAYGCEVIVCPVRLGDDDDLLNAESRR